MQNVPVRELLKLHSKHLYIGGHMHRKILRNNISNYMQTNSYSEKTKGKLNKIIFLILSKKFLTNFNDPDYNLVHKNVKYRKIYNKICTNLYIIKQTYIS